MADLIVRDFKTRKEVSRVTVTNPFSMVYRRGEHLEKYAVVMLGMLRQMNTEEYFIDDSEIEDDPHITKPTRIGSDPMRGDHERFGG